MKRATFALAVALLASAFCAQQSRAWGCKGHQTVAFLAEQHLTPEAKALVQSLLGAHPIDPGLPRWCGNAVTDWMADGATWPDDIRGQAQNGPWHYIDIPRGAARGPLDAYCGEGGCILRALREQIAILKDKDAASAKRADALRYIIHLMGDLHQPLHATTNSDEGGNCTPVKYFRRRPQSHNGHFSPNLHGIWDTEIVERDSEGASAAEYAETLDAAFAGRERSWERAGIRLDDWAWESHDLAETAAYQALDPQPPVQRPAPVRSCTDDNNIGERMFRLHLYAGGKYQEEAGRVVEERLAQAGVRLAMILNEAAASLR